MTSASQPIDAPARLAVVRALQAGRHVQADSSLEALVHAAARMAATPMAAVTAIDDREQHLLAWMGMPGDSQPLDAAFCTHALVRDELLEVPDARMDTRFADKHWVTGATRVRFYAGQPLTVGGQRIGTLCVVDVVPRRLDDSQRRELAALGRAAAELLDGRFDLSARRERDAMLRQLSGQVPGVMYTYDEDPEGRGHFRFISDGIERVLGVTPALAMAQPERLFRLVHPDDVAGLQQELALHRRDLTPLVHAYRQRNPDGEWRWIETRATPQRLPDGSTRWHAFSTDVTRRRSTAEVLRRAEERWNLAAAAAGIGIAEFDVASGELQLDARACANHGLPPSQLRLPMAQWLASIDEASRDRVAAGLQRAIERGEPMDMRFPIRDGAHGHRRWLEVLVHAGRIANGRAASLVGTCRDVTAQEEAAQLARGKAEAERASRAKTTFLSRVSHELRTPLNAILGFAQLMALDRDHPLQAAQASRLAGLRRAGSHLLELINDVLDLSRIEREDFALRIEPVEVEAIIATCLETVQPLAVDRGITLHAPARGCGCFVHGDARAIEQVLMNLLSNAIKFNRIGGEVQVSSWQGSDRVRIAVRDTGHGIERGAQARLFQAFERLGAERRRVEGSGLGLVIARELAEAMDGRIEVESTPGAGSTFTLELPASAARAPAPVAAPAPTAETSPAAPAASPRRVLYIEDEALNQLLMQEIFRACPQWTLSLADSGAQGLALARDLRPDLLLVDMNLPDIDGLSLIAKLRADPATRSLPCIAVSADAMGEQIDAARAAGFDDYWTKPVDVRRVIGDLAQRLGNQPPTRSSGTD